jgi:hypothetical protein
VPRTGRATSRLGTLEYTVLGVGAVVLAGTTWLGVSVARADAIASVTPPHVTVTWGPDESPGPGVASPTTAAPAPPSSEATAGQTDSVSVTGAANVSGAGQTFAVSVLPGPLTVNPASEAVTLSDHRGNAGDGPYRGDLSSVTVVDARGSLVGWNAAVSLQAIGGVSASQLAGARLCVTPHPPTVVAGNPGEVRAATPSCGGVDQPVAVFSAPPGGGGGTFDDTARLTLRIPAGAVTPVVATLALTVH